MKASFIAAGLVLAAGVVQAQSLTKEEYESFHLKRVAAVNCATKSGGRMILKSSDQGRTYNLLYAGKAHQQPKIIARGVLCEDHGPRNWGLHCTSAARETLFHVSATGYYQQKPDGRSYDHKVAFSVVRHRLPDLPGLDKKSVPYQEEAFSSKCLIQRY